MLILGEEWLSSTATEMIKCSSACLWVSWRKLCRQDPTGSCVMSWDPQNTVCLKEQCAFKISMLQNQYVWRISVPGRSVCLQDQESYNGPKKKNSVNKGTPWQKYECIRHGEWAMMDDGLKRWCAELPCQLGSNLLNGCNVCEGWGSLLGDTASHSISVSRFHHSIRGEANLLGTISSILMITFHHFKVQVQLYSECKRAK